MVVVFSFNYIYPLKKFLIFRNQATAGGQNPGEEIFYFLQNFEQGGLNA